MHASEPPAPSRLMDVGVPQCYRSKTALRSVAATCQLLATEPERKRLVRVLSA